MDTVRVLAADAVEKVGNGHPGTAMSLAPAAYLLFQKVMRHDPRDDRWTGRDRFILSPGHTSLTLYLQLFLAGYGMELEDIKSLRTWGSKTPGHPEYRHTTGVEITTGPLGQGLASAVGFAYAQRYTRGLFDPDAPAGDLAVRPHGLRDRLRRRPPGGGHLRGVLAGRGAGAGQPRGDLRPEPHLHRGRHRRGLHRGRPGPLRGLRLAREPGGLDEDRGLRRGRRRALRRDPGGQGRDHQALDDRAAHDHRVPGARRSRTPAASTAPSSGPRRSPRPRRSSASTPSSPSRSRTRSSPTPAASRTAMQQVRDEWEQDFQPWREANPERASLYDRIRAEELPEDYARARSPSSRPARTWPPGPRRGR